MRRCGYCEKSIVAKNAQARFCSDKCRTYARRASKRQVLPAALTSRGRWIRYSDRVRKIPLTIDGRNASSTNPQTWSSYAEANASTVGAGLGFVLGDSIGCIDLDHCLIDGELTEAARAFVADYPSHYIEVSPSGDGLHIWGLSDEQPGTRRVIDGLNVERYSTGRYITITRNVYQAGHLLPL